MNEPFHVRVKQWFGFITVWNALSQRSHQDWFLEVSGQVTVGNSWCPYPVNKSVVKPVPCLKVRLRVPRNRLSCILPSNTLGLASPPHWCPSESPAKALLSRITEIKSHAYVTKANGKGKKNEQRALSEKMGGTACLVPVRKSRFLKRNDPWEQVRDGNVLSLQRPGDVSRMKPGLGAFPGVSSLFTHSLAVSPACRH